MEEKQPSRHRMAEANIVAKDKRQINLCLPKRFINLFFSYFAENFMKPS